MCDAARGGLLARKAYRGNNYMSERSTPYQPSLPAPLWPRRPFLALFFMALRLIFSVTAFLAALLRWLTTVRCTARRCASIRSARSSASASSSELLLLPLSSPPPLPPGAASSQRTAPVDPSTDRCTSTSRPRTASAASAPAAARWLRSHSARSVCPAPRAAAWPPSSSSDNSLPSMLPPPPSLPPSLPCSNAASSAFWWCFLKPEACSSRSIASSCSASPTISSKFGRT
mmetsp:Transcript_39235/g.100243  ORF Transcript_39235/g.100243 Transcript_39235/m.100243 type:complete len:230 (+) Transcript_39235:70-759(+)